CGRPDPHLGADEDTRRGRGHSLRRARRVRAEGAPRAAPPVRGPLAMSDRIAVLIVDDHPVVRQGLRTLLELQDDLEIAGEAADGAEAVELVRGRPPDVVLMDLVMPGLDGIDATRAIRATSPATRVIVL